MKKIKHILLSAAAISLAYSLQGETSLITPEVSSTSGTIIVDGFFTSSVNNGLAPLTTEMAGVTNGSANRNGGYLTNDAVITDAGGDYTLQIYVGNNGVGGGFDWNSESRIGLFDTSTSITNAASLTTAINTFANDADVSFTLGSVSAQQTTPTEDTFDLWTYDFTISDNGGSVFGSDLNFAARWDINSGGNFFITTAVIPEPSASALIAALGVLGLVYFRRRR